MKRIIPYIVLGTLAFCTFSCRPTSDELLSYGQNDSQVFQLAKKSYVEEFKALWYAMNENYCIWDYEQKCGLDWDEVYDTYLPKFEEMDKRNGNVTDDELASTYREFIDQLHDGHMYVEIWNKATGHYLTINPNEDRNMRERKDRFLSEATNITNLDAYRQGSVEAKYRVKSFDAASAGLTVAEKVDTVLVRVVHAADTYIAAVEAAGGPTGLYDSLYNNVVHLKEHAENLHKIIQNAPTIALEEDLSTLVKQYNALCARYSLAADQIGVTMEQIEQQMAADGLKSLRFALFEGNIAYLRIAAFRLTPHLDPAYRTTDTSSMYYAYQTAVNRVWHHWFDTIQTLHANGQLGGVILDLRNNGGGLVNDYQYALGALLPSGGWASHTMRTKNGSGRLDFSPLTPFYVPTYPDEHAVITQEPIVVLANSLSGSLAENTTWGVTSQPNGYFIGTRTYGALSALSTDPQFYSETYSGAFGVKHETAVYGFIPKFVCLYEEDLHPVEGYGFVPDKDTPLDIDLWKSTGRDNQLETALDYIQSK